MDQYIADYLYDLEVGPESTYKTRRADLRSFNAWLTENEYKDAAALETKDIHDYLMAQKREGYMKATLESRYQSVKNLYEQLTVLHELYDESPFAKLKRSKYTNTTVDTENEQDDDKKKGVTKDEMEQLAANVGPPSLRNELIIRLFFHTGMRRGELVSLAVDNVDLLKRQIRITTSKTRKARTVYYQPELDVMMQQWFEGGYRDSYLHAEDTDRAFLTERGPITNRTVNDIVYDAAENAGIQEVKYVDQSGRPRRRITPHALRHGHAVHALKSGVDIRTLQKHLGHEKHEMALHYLDLATKDVQDGMQRFNA